jgi:hypothetical protein
MTWGAVGGAVIGGAVSMYGQNKAAKAAKQGTGQSAGDASQAANAMSWQDIQRVNDLNRQNAMWTQQQNQMAQDRNTVDSTNQWGSVSRERDPVTGELKQTSTLAGPWAGIADKGAASYATMQDALGSGFNVNSDYMNAMRAQLMPGYQQAADAARARAAAMGTGFNSGAANAGMEDQLGRNLNDLNQKAVLGGYNAWLQDQANSRSNMGAIMGGQTGMKSLGQQDAWAQANTPQMVQQNVPFAPQNNTYAAGQEDYLRSQANAANMGSAAAGWGNLAGTIGQVAGNKDVQQGIKNWWGGAGTTPYGTTPGSQQSQMLAAQDAGF